MREDICTIPVSEGFEPKQGCPLCRMYAVAEKRAVDYIMGAAMMEPDVRIETNRLGFCARHYQKMRKANNRLSLALMLESHITEIKKDVFGDGKKFFKPSAGKSSDKAKKLEQSCFICDRIKFGTDHMLDTIYRTYDKDKDFRRLFDEQTEFCLPHYVELVSNVPGWMDKNRAADLTDSAKRITVAYLDELGKDVHHFCEMFDYRNSGEDADWGNSRDSIERTIAYLNGELPDSIKVSDR